MQAKGNFTKSYAPRNEATPEAKVSTKKSGEAPKKTLSVKEKGSSEYQELTGLFESTSKASGKTYLSGKVRGGTDRYYLFEDIDKKTGEFKGYSLNVKDTTNPESKFVKVASLKEITTKTGNKMLAGESSEGHNFYVQEPRKKQS